MHTPSIKEESMTTVILKCFALICVMTATYYFFKAMIGSTGADMASPLIASMSLGRAFGAAVASVSFWWMASVLSLLTRIANNGEKAAPQMTHRASFTMEPAAKPKPATRAEDDTTAKYEL